VASLEGFAVARIGGCRGCAAASGLAMHNLATHLTWLAQRVVVMHNGGRPGGSIAERQYWRWLVMLHVIA
jgi:hypothetical protein